MTRRLVPFLLCGAVALGVSGCSSDAKSNSGSSSTLATTTTTSAVASSTSTATTAAPSSTAASATASSTTTASGASTTVAGRVVTKPDDNVKLGDSGEGVKQIQTALVAAGYKVVVDGKFGPQTSQAVQAFQKAHGLQQDGVVGPLTWAKLGNAPTATTTKGATTTAAATTTPPTTII